MTKKLIYSFYLSRDTYDLKINDIHFRCLDRFKNSFDEVDITFIMDDKADVDILKDAEERFISIFLGKNVSFSIIENNEFRESRVFYDKVATKLSENELVFFAHNKGVSNVKQFDINEIYTWVCGMYYYSLNFMDEVEYKLVGRKYFSYGSFLTINEEPEKYNKHGWYYIGTFFWINCKKIEQYMTMHNIPLPILADRFYDEEFLGNIIQAWPMIMATGHQDKYLKYCYNYYEKSREFIRLLDYDDMEEFERFYSEMTE